MRDNSVLIMVLILALLSMISPIDLILDAVSVVDVPLFGLIVSSGGGVWGHGSPCSSTTLAGLKPRKGRKGGLPIDFSR